MAVENSEKSVLSHGAKPGYGLAFAIALAVAVTYLGYIFITAVLK